MTAITITVSFNDEKHERVLAWLNSEPGKRSEKIQNACEVACYRHAEYTLADVMRRLDDIERNGVMVTHVPAPGDDNEPVEAADALEGLGM